MKIIPVLNYIYLLTIVSILSSCEEVIDLNLETSDPALVMDGEIRLNSTAKLTINYTTDYYGTEEVIYENDAVVILSNSKGASEELVLQGDGVYTGNQIHGEKGVEYTLSVTIDEREYTASSTMLTPSSLVALTPIESSRSIGSDTYYGLEVAFTNNVNEENYYLVKYLYEDDDGDQEDYSTLSWEYFSTNEVLTYSGYYTFEESTVVNVKIYSIDEGTYVYYSALEDIDGQGFDGASTPYNPESNFGEDVLGYFRAWSMDQQEVTMPEEQ